MQDRSHDIDSAAAGTCEWLLRHEKYTTWAACDRGLLWIKGKPGSGKSTVLKYALSNHKVRDGALVLSFFFHGRGDELQKSPLGFFRSLLHQILGQTPDALQDLVGVFESKCEKNGKPGAGWYWHEGELRSFLQSSLPKVLRSRPICLFIDALDECGKDNAVKLVGIFSTLLKSLESQPMGLQQFHICFSCRHYPILDVDENRFEICTEHENERDISAFVDDKLAAFRTRVSSKIPDLITARASGVFMWARLVVEQILDLERDGAGPAKMEAVISAIPPNLNDLYHELVRGMDARSKKLIQWVCFAIRPLNLDELRWAMVIEAECPNRSLQVCKSAEDYVADSAPMKRQAQTLSRGLVEVTHTQTVQFIHQSVKDFFFEKDFLVLGGGKTLAEAAIRAHLRFSKICLRYLAMETISQVTKSSLDDFPFLRYAATSWVTHTKQCDVGSVPRDDLLPLFAWPSNALVESWVRVHDILDIDDVDRPTPGMNLVHIASMHGLVGLLTAILQMGGEAWMYIDAKAAQDRTPLTWAAIRGHEAIVRLLLETGDVDTNAKASNGWTPLMWAAARGHEAIVRLLLETGDVDTNAKDSNGLTPLMGAAIRGHEAIVRLLLETGDVDTNAKDSNGWTPLMGAASNGHEAIVRLLLETGDVDTNAKVSNGRTPLMGAASNGHEAIVRLLLETGDVDTDAKDNKGHTALSLAAEDGHEAVVQLIESARACTEIVTIEDDSLDI
jgi:ankyrin repeat protein